MTRDFIRLIVGPLAVQQITENLLPLQFLLLPLFFPLLRFGGFQFLSFLLLDFYLLLTDDKLLRQCRQIFIPGGA